MSTPQIKYTFPESLWAGTEHSLTLAMEAHDALMAGIFDKPVSEEDNEVPYGYSTVGSIGVVSIRGPLVNNDSPYNRYRGVTSYNDVRRAMLYAATQPEAGAILLDIDSGGGAVSGVADVATLISTIDKTIKPVYSYTDGVMASAAYWLGSAARAVYVSETSTTGSIGVIATHQEYSKAFKEMGIGVTVMRAGEFKALINSMEPLTDTAKSRMQEMLNAAYSVFAEHVSTQLGVSLPVFEATMGQGREFFGKDAVTVGLAKGVKTFDSMVSMLQKKVIDINAKKDQTAGSFQRGPNMTRQALTEQQIAALAAGAASADPLDEAALAAQAAAEAEAAAQAAALAATDAAALAAAAVVTPPAADANTALVSYLQAQVKDKDALLVAQSVELSGVKAKVAGMEATHAGLMKIAATLVTNMKIGLGQAKTDFSAMTPDLLLAEHDATAKQFAATFKVGGVAAVSVEAKPAAAIVDPLFKARLAANRYPTRK